jgi:hypothetical protein
MPLRPLIPTVSSHPSDLTFADMLHEDFDIHGGITNVQQVIANWENIMQNAQTLKTGFIVLEHDLFQQTVEVATGYILPDALARKPALNITTVNTCLNRPPGDAYLETNDNTTNPLPLTCMSLPLDDEFFFLIDKRLQLREVQRIPRQAVVAREVLRRAGPSLRALQT